jgi:uncharacterized protein involved in exopolysaccharide biosynthesis/Mrp family chromosome partitioning ATPase
VLFQQILPQAADVAVETDFQELYLGIRRKWHVIALVTLLATALGLYAAMTAPPSFIAFDTVFLGDGAQISNSDPGANFLSDYQLVSSVNTQIQLIQSPDLLQQAILETGLNAFIRPVGWEPLSYWKWRYLKHKSIAAFAPGPADLVAQFAMFGDPASQGVSYRLRFGPDGHYELFSARSGKAAALSGVLGQVLSGDGISMVIKSATDAAPPPAGAEYSLSILPAKLMVNEVLGSLDVAATGPTTSPTNVAAIAMTWSNPYEATGFVNQLAQDFIQSQLAWKTQSASNTETYIAQQLKNITAALTQANDNQASYQSKTGIVDVTSNAQAVIGQLTSYQNQRSALLLQQEALGQLVKSLDTSNSDFNPYLISQANDPVLSNMSTTLATAEVALRTAQLQFVGQAPQIKQAQATVDQIEDAIKTILNNDAAVATKNLQNLDELIAKYQDDLKAMPGESLQVNQLNRSSDVLGTLYGLLMQKEEEAEVSKAATIEDTRIISHAQLPLTARTPRPALDVAAGFILGLVAGFALVIVQRAFSRRFRTDSEVRRQVPLPVYGLIPMRNARELREGVFSPVPTSAFSEAFRLLRCNLYAIPATQKLRVLLVTSSSVGDGRTLIAANLAKTLADDGRRVLLIDADLHCGNLAERLGVPPGPGLSDWLLTRVRVPFAAVPGQKFSLLRAGNFPFSPAELLNGAVTDDLFAVLHAEFEFIVLDTPAFPQVSDALCLVRQADVVLSVVSVDYTLRQALMTHCETIGVSDKAHGLIINRVERSRFAASGGAGVYRGGRRTGRSLGKAVQAALDRITGGTQQAARRQGRD